MKKTGDKKFTAGNNVNILEPNMGDKISEEGPSLMLLLNQEYLPYHQQPHLFLVNRFLVQ